MPSTIQPDRTDWRSRVALLLHEQGQSAEAIDLASQELRLAESFGTPVPIATARQATEARTDPRRTAETPEPLQRAERSEHDQPATNGGAR